MPKSNYLDETLKRWPIILMIGTVGYFGITKLYDIESKVETIRLLTEKDKEAIDTRFTIVETKANNTENKTNEIEKTVIRIAAIVPDEIEIKRKGCK